MKKLFTLIIFLLMVAVASAQPIGPGGIYGGGGTGDVATDTIWDTAGDLIYGTGSNTAAKLGIGTAYQLLMVNAGATAPAWTSTLGATGTRLTKGWFTDLEVTNAIAGSVTGNAGTATALAADPADCAAGTVATAIAASGALTCGKAIGTDIQAYHANLAALAGLSPTENGVVGWGSGPTMQVFTTHKHSDSGEQFYASGDATKTLKMYLTNATSGADAIFDVQFTADATLKFTQPTTGDSVAYGSAPIRFNTGTTTARVKTVSDAAATLVEEATATGGIILGDSSPDAEGELGYATNQLSIHDGTASRSLLQVASTTITKSEYLPIRYAEDDDSVTAPAAVAEIGTSTMVARSFAEDADNGVVFWWHVPMDYSAGIKYRVYYAIDTNAGADETIAFSMAGCSVGNLDAIACSEGTAVVVTDELDANYDTGELIVTGWSTAVTVTDITAGELAKLLFIRDVSEDDAVGHALVTAIEIKYQAKVNASSDY